MRIVSIESATIEATPLRMAAYTSHLRRIHNNEVFYNGQQPTKKPFTTDRDVLDAHHKFIRDDNEPADSLVKEYYESLIKDCVLVDLSRYKEEKVSPEF